MRQHCAQCLSEVFAGGVVSPTGETLCGECYSALWGPRTNGNRLASTNGHSRPRRLKRGRPVWISGTSRESRDGRARPTARSLAPLILR